MKKNLLTLLIILLSVIYGGNNLSAQVAKVGNTTYATIDEAIANWKHNTTLTLLNDVTLSDVINLSSTEYHVLDLGTYTMTAASKKNAINIVNNGRTSASYTLDIKADATNPGGITATGKYIVNTTGKSGVKDRPIIRFYGGIFTASNIIYHSGSNGTNCPQFQFYGGEFNGTLYANRAKITFNGGTFNSTINLSLDSNADLTVNAGKFKDFQNRAGSSLNSDKIVVNNGVYVDEEGYLVFGGSVIVGYKVDNEFKEDYNGYTERYHYNNNNSYLTYSSAQANGLYYDNIKKLLDDNKSQTVWIHGGTLDLTSGSISFTGTIIMPREDSEFRVKFSGTNPNDAPTLKVQSGVGEISVKTKDIIDELNGCTTRVYSLCPDLDENGECPHVARACGKHYDKLNNALNDNVTEGNVITLIKNTSENVIALNKNVTINFNGKTCTNTNTNGLVIPNGKTITLTGGTLIAENANFVISTSGNLTMQDMTINGTVEYLGGEMFTDKAFTVSAKKYFKGVGTGHTQNWSTISTPIADAKIPEATAGTHDLYRFDEPEQEWEYYNDADGQTFKKLELGRGYLYANAEDITFELTGELNIGSVEFPLSYTKGNSLAGFNMIGNPFTHTISESNLSTSAKLADGFYVVGEEGTWIAKTDGKIAPMESVLIQASAKANLTIAPSTPNNGSKRAARNENSYLTINVASKTHSDVAHISFNEEGMGLDKINHRNPDNPMIYIPVEGKNYAIAMMNQDVKEVPVYFNANRMAEYTISIEQKNCEFNTMTLVDKLTGIETNMLIEDYSFMARTFDDANRFIIRMSIEDNDDSETENFAFISNGQMIIEEIEGQGLVRIFDVMGRHIAQHSVTGSASIATDGLATGMYIIQMADDNGVKVQKIIID